jgi:hypothetical protein
MSNDEPKKDEIGDFNTRAKLFLQDLELAQIKRGVTLRPIITQYGPDLQLQDKFSQPAPVEKIESQPIKAVEKVK